MSKLTPLQVLERSHSQYLEYEQAFNDNPFDDSKIKEELKKVIDSGVDFDSKEFEDSVIDLMIEKPAKRTDVNNAALKFLMFTEFFMLTQSEEISDKILKDYNQLPIKDTLKSFYSIEDGKFVRNEKVPINIEKDKLRALYKSLQNIQ